MDPISCLAPLPFPSASPYTDAAVASALRFSSMSSDSSASSSYTPSSNLFADFACAGFASEPAPVVSCCGSVEHSAAPRASRAAGKQASRLGPAAGAGGGRARKRRARASKRAATTYISTDPANFRLMVQHVTGVQAEPGVLLPTPAFDDAVLLDLDAPIFGGHPLLPANDAAALRHQQQQQQHYQQQQQQEPCFPTLDSWSVMYESSELAAALTQQ